MAVAADIQRAIDRHKAVQVGAVVVTALSGLAFLGGGLYAMATGVAKDGGETPEAAAGSGFQVTLPMRDIKSSWRADRWRTDPQWRFYFLMILAGSSLGVGLLATIFVLGDVFAKLLMTLMFLYVLVRTVWAFTRA